MAEITAITPQIKDKTRCNIEVDGRFFCGMKLETAVKNHLKAGVTVTEEQLSALQLESEKMTALDRALEYISVSMHTENQIRKYLSKKGYLQDVVEYVIGKMKEYGYLDDGAYARAYVESVQKRKGRRLIESELRNKGVSKEKIEEALEGISGEEETASLILQKYLKGKPLDRKTLQKGYAYLIGKGFDYDTARDALRSLGEEDED